MVQVVEMDEKNQVVQRYGAEVTLSSDVIVLKPGVPPLGSPEFDKYLREWHEINNDRTIVLADAAG
jgi:hypothetical protein